MRIASTISNSGSAGSAPPAPRSGGLSLLAPLVRAEPCLEFAESSDHAEADFGVCAECGWLDHEHADTEESWAEILAWPVPAAPGLKAS